MSLNKPKQILLSICLLVFVGLVAFTVWPRKTADTFKIPDFKTNLASDLLDWTWQDLPVAESEEMIEAIGEELAFDDALYRVYTREGVETVSVAVWAAFWFPGKVDITDVNTHEPDSCWVHNGWAIDQRSDEYTFEFPENRNMLSAKYRLMEKSGSKVHVAFWHKVGDVNLKIERWSGSATKYPEIIRQTGFQSKAEQYFIRISSTHSFDDLIADPDFRSILEGIAQFGLWEIPLN